MTTPLAIFCKSFAEDFNRLHLLLDSAARFASGYSFILSVPRADRGALAARFILPERVTVVYDEDYCTVSEVGDHGWVQQQYCKMSLHRLGLSETYLIVDSDSYFISAVQDADFLCGTAPRYVYSSIFTKFLPGNTALEQLLSTDQPAHVPPAAGVRDGFAGQLAQFQAWIGSAEDQGPVTRAFWINRLFNVPPDTALQPGQIMTASILAAFETFLREHGLSIAWAIRNVPWEYNWYGSWASTYAHADACPSVAPTLHFASDADVQRAMQSGITREVIARKFRIVAMAARHFERLCF